MKNKTAQKNIPKGWQQVRLGDISDITNGKTNSQDAVDDGMYPLFDRSVAIKKSDKYLFDRTAIILPGEGAEFIPRYYSGKFDLHQRAYAILPNDSVHPPYLFQYLYANRSIFAKNAVGSTVKSLRLPIIQAIDVLLPPLSEQKRIAEILKAVDEEIQKTDEIISTTEKLKKGLMQQLFTKGIGHTRFKKTKLGEIPTDWEIAKLEEVAKVQRGKFSHRPRNNPKFYGGNIPFIQTGDVVNANGRIQTHTQSLNEEGLAISKMFPKGTIVLTIAANIGDTGILEFDSCFPDSLVGITVDSKMNNIFLEYYLRTRKEYLNSIATQSAQKNINLQKLNPMLVIKPPLSEQQRIAEILSSVDDKVSINRKLKAKWVFLQKGLMQDLLSGKVRVNV